VRGDKEDAFRECGIPYSDLDAVFAYLEESVPVSVGRFGEDSRSLRAPPHCATGSVQHFRGAAWFNLADVKAYLPASTWQSKKVLSIEA
jgi:hypothetical protein